MKTDEESGPAVPDARRGCVLDLRARCIGFGGPLPPSGRASSHRGGDSGSLPRGAARGGAEKLHAVQSSAEKYAFQTSKGYKDVIVIRNLRPKQVRIDYTFEATGKNQESHSIAAYDGTDAWTVTEAYGKKQLRVLRGEEMAGLRQEATMQYEDDPEAHGEQAQVVGLETLAGRSAYKVQFVSPDKTVRYQFFDSESSLLVRTEWITGGRGKEKTDALLMSDYRPVGGLLFAHAITVERASGERVTYAL